MEKRRLNVSGVLRILGVSRSGFRAWKTHLHLDRELRKKALKKKSWKYIMIPIRTMELPKLQNV